MIKTEQITIAQAYGEGCAHAAKTTSEFTVQHDTEGNGFIIVTYDGRVLYEAFSRPYVENAEGTITATVNLRQFV